jgi:Rad3-related DNA helicase
MVLQTQSYNNFLPSLGCSYYAARSMADDAQLVFCPYNYIINPVIRGAMEVDIKGAIVILDEAQYFSPPHLIKFNFL